MQICDKIFLSVNHWRVCMKCVSVKRGKLREFIPLIGSMGGGASYVQLGDNCRRRVEVTRKGMNSEMTEVTNVAPTPRTMKKPKKRGQRVKYYLLHPIAPENETELEKVVLYFDTTYPRAEMRLMSGMARPLADLMGHYCEEPAVSNKWRLCSRGAAMVVLYAGTTVMLWDRHGQVFEVTNTNGSVTCKKVRKQREAV